MKISEKSILSKNNHPLYYTLFEPEPELKKNITILIAPAMAVLQRYYKNFAEFLCTKGYYVITFDYIGIGKSFFKKDDSITYEDWGKYDITLLINWIETNLQTAIYYIAHSAGGQLLGLTPSNTKINKVFIISSGIGYWKNWPFPRNFMYFLNWHFFFRLIISLYGHSPSWVLGEEIPKGIIKQWLSWARKKRFMLDDKTIETYFNNIKVDTTFIIFSDDKFAPYKNAKALASFYNATKVDFTYLRPIEFSVKNVGHFGFFRNIFSDSLWPLLDL